MLRILNTSTREKAVFEPIEPGRVRMYVCGITVYDYCHIGHARMMMAFDIVRRWLRASGYAVTYVRNITDIDDKIIKRATENNESIGALTERFITAMNEDADALGIERPDHEPRATEHVPEMLDMIGRLEDRQLAYASTDGDVNFAVRRFPGYGRLSGKTIDDLRAGERVMVNAGKADPLDFVLWKKAKPEEPVDAKWPSPWGDGRPGWAIECSAMSCALLGNHFDIHGGGEDLQFPHHENEIAQSEGANGERFVNVWMHNGFVNVDETKMSKSLGNFFTIREVLAQRPQWEDLRFLLVRTHYRSPLNYSDVHLEDARSGLTRLYTALNHTTVEDGDIEIDWTQPHALRFREAMDDDFNTPLAMAALFDLASEVNRTRNTIAAAQLKALGGVLGLLQQRPIEYLQGASRVERVTDGAVAGPGGAGKDSVVDSTIEERIAARAAAKKARDFIEADRIRDALAAEGVVLEDSAAGTVWRRA